ncbi:C-type lectin domain family 5 member A-like isoform X2 [Sphaerodactylus townsendi]|uniref:C-type lectin domain family 5 member A-like isoform X2 n=1 Tax=Sphaerodactylus townsendi TaxID=933632 RepID=UPI002026A448|nr:C-type lectin domain family 5 member A-like isoform X2 [Sphaerodactylus townsendi]
MKERVSQIFYTPVLEESTATPKDCSVGWVAFKGKCYHFSTMLQTWEKHVKACSEFDSRPAVVNTQEELKFLNSRTQHERYFIGLTLRDGKWTWIDGTQFDPNIFGIAPGQFACAVIGLESSIDSASCFGPYRCICEKNA